MSAQNIKRLRDIFDVVYDSVSGTLKTGGGSSNTSGSALESGGNLAGINTKLPASLGINTAANSLSIAPASDAFFTAGIADVRGTGTINGATLNAVYSIALNNGVGTASFVVAGLSTSGATLTIEGSDDSGTTWNLINGIAPSTGIPFSTLTLDQQFRVNAGARTNLRLRVSAVGAGTIAVASNISTASSLISLSTLLPQLPSSVGAKTSINSFSITPASDALFAITSESGLLSSRNTALTNTAIQIKATAGQTRGWNLINLNTVAVYVKLYDALAVNVVIGTTAVVRTLAIPAGGVFFLEAQPVSQDDFLTAISIACVNGLADSNTTAPTIPIHAAVRYK